MEALESRWVPTTVTNLNDAGPGSLRQAILDTPSGGTVDFQPGLTGTITLESGELAIAKTLTVTGPGSDFLAVSGSGASRVFNIAATFTVTIAGLTITGGGAVPQGGGIYNAGILTITNSVLSGNRASSQGGAIHNAGTLTVTGSILNGNAASRSGGALVSAQGGAIFNASGAGPLIVSNSILSDNTAYGLGDRGGTGYGRGGAIYNSSGTGSVTVSASTLSGNQAAGGTSRLGLGYAYGGGIANYGTMTVIGSSFSNNSALGVFYPGGRYARGGGILNGGTLTITGSTISGNRASGSAEGSTGGGIRNEGTLTVTSSTISGNHAGGGVGPTGGGMWNDGTVNARNTIVAQNTATASPDMQGALASQGHNLVGDGTGGSGYHATDLVGTTAAPIDPLLGALENNGGPTFTHALLPGSPSLSAGDNADPPATDQRGAPRLIGGTIDIGAFEVQPVRVWIGGAYLDVCAGTRSGDPNAWSNPLNWLGGTPTVWDTAAFVERVLVAQCSGTDIYGPFTTSAVVDAAFAGSVWGLDSNWAGTVSLARDLTLTGPSVWSGGTMTGGTLTNFGSLSVSAGSLTGTLRNWGAILLGISGAGESFLVNGDYIQSGVLFVGPESTFRVTGTYAQEAGGITYLLFGTLTAPTIDLAADSSLAGSGTINGNLRNAGWVSVGDYGAAGYLIVNGDYTQTSTGWLVLELGSLAAEDYDVMVVTGTAVLDGVIYLGLLPSFTPTAGAGYAVLWFGTRGAGEPAVYFADLENDFYFELEFSDSYLALWLWPTA